MHTSLTSPSLSYRIEQTVGQGAMGIVYRALDIALARPVAIKTLEPHHHE